MLTRNNISMQQKYNRVIVLVDMDCFYCQVEEKLDPHLKGQPLAVVQYNAWRGGGIIAVNYAARAKGVTRHMRGDEAKERCPEIHLVKVPNIREKADLSKYRDAGKEVANVLQRFTPLLERASVDEAYLDVTEAVNKRLGDMNAGSFMLQPQGLTNTYAVGYAGIGDYVNVITKRFNDPNVEDFDLESGAFAQAHDSADMAAVRQSDIRLLIGAAIAGEVRAAVKVDTGYECSAGVAHNKILAKLACGMNKPNKQTILPLAQIPSLFQTLSIGKIRGLGGKFGEEICSSLKIQFLSELLPYTELDLQKKFDEKSGTWLYNMCRGIDLEAVTPRFYSKSIGCCKKFPGRNNITGLNTLRHWLGELANEVCDRIEKDMLENNRRAKQMVISFVQEFDREEVSSSRSTPLNSYDHESLTKCSLEVIQSHTKQFFKIGSTLVLNNPIKFLGISVGKFETIQNGQGKLQEMFANLAAKKKNEADNKLVQEVQFESETLTKDMQAVQLPLVKKPTFMQSFLRRACETSTTNTTIAQSSLNTEIEDCKDEETDTHTITVRRTEIDKNFTVSATPAAEKRSFFLNALKRQRTEESVGGEVENCDNTATNMEANGSDVSKSFFAKILKNSKEMENRCKYVKTINVGELFTDDIFSATELPNSNIGIDRTTVALQQTEGHTVENDAFVKNETTSTLSENVGLSNNKRKFTALQEKTRLQSDEIATSMKHNPRESFEASYAEFAVPELRAEFLEMSKCEICNANVPTDERSLQLHQDHHIAMQLSQQLRYEHRTEVKAQSITNKPQGAVAAPNKKLKKSPGQSTKAISGKNGKNGIDIKKFLKPGVTSSTNVPGLVAEYEAINLLDNTVDTVLCDECNTLIACSELQAHKDFHVAKALQRELNMLEVRTVPVTKKASASSHNIPNAKQPSLKNIKPITQFFSQSNC